MKKDGKFKLNHEVKERVGQRVPDRNQPINTCDAFKLLIPAVCRMYAHHLSPSSSVDEASI